MNNTRRYSPEVRERAVRLVFAQEAEHSSQWAAICSIAEKVRCSSEALRKWVPVEGTLLRLHSAAAPRGQPMNRGLTAPRRMRWARRINRP